LELRQRVVRAAILDGEEAAGRVGVLLRLEGEREAMRAGRQRRIEREADELIRPIVDPRMRFDAIDENARYGERDRIEPYGRMWTIERDVDRNFARRLGFAGDDRHLQRIVRRSRIRGKPQRRRRSFM